VGYWSSIEEVAGQWRADRRFDPAMPRAEAHARRDRWREALERARGWVKPDATA
jgi:glycerol kinase